MREAAGAVPDPGARCASDYFESHVETMARPDLERLQEARLMRLLDHACEHVPLIAETWRAAGLTAGDIGSLREFKEKAPFISKDSVRAFRDRHGDPYGGLKSGSGLDLTGVTFTSGTTGDPTPVPRGARSVSEACIMRDTWMMGSRPGDHVVVMRPTFRVGHMGPYYEQAGFIPVALSHSPEALPRFIDLSKRFRPTSHFFLSTPLLIALENLFEQNGEDPRDVFASYKSATIGGEPLSPRRRELVSSWGVELRELGGLGEGIIMVECDAREGMHAWEDHVLVECLDPLTDEPVGNGEIGELVVTVLTDPFLPMVRYRTDDLVTVDDRPCRCGRTHARLRIVGRKSDQIYVAGRSLLPRDLQVVVESERATRAGLFQIIRSGDDMDHLRVRIGYDPGEWSGTEAALADKLRDGIESSLGVNAEILLVDNAELLRLGPPHKIPRVAKS